MKILIGIEIKTDSPEEIKIIGDNLSDKISQLPFVEDVIWTSEANKVALALLAMESGEKVN